MSYANYVNVLKGVTGPTDIFVPTNTFNPNTSTPFMVSAPYLNTGASGFTGNGATVGINSTYTSDSGYNFMIYSGYSYPSGTNGNFVQWSIICTNGATAPYQTTNPPNITYISNPTFPVWGFTTNTLLNISLPTSGPDAGNIYQPRWYIYGIPLGVYWIYINVIAEDARGWSSNVPIVAELACINIPFTVNIATGFQAGSTALQAAYNSANSTCTINLTLYPGTFEGTNYIKNPIATIKLVKRW
jgi:hypothetical protein